MVQTNCEANCGRTRPTCEAMPKNSSPLRHEPRPRKFAQPVERPLNAIIKYVEESCPMRLDEAMEYFSSCLPKAFRANEGVYSPKGREGVAKGERLMRGQTLKYRTTLSSLHGDHFFWLSEGLAIGHEMIRIATPLLSYPILKL